MAVQLFYVDESFDEERFCLTAMRIKHREWQACFDAVRAHRLALHQAHGIRIRKELHARDLVAGRGDLGTPQPLTKWQRSRIFLGVLRLIASLPVQLINVCLDVQRHAEGAHLVAWDRLVNRIERSMKAVDESEGPTRKRLVAIVRQSMPGDDAEAIALRLEAFACRAMIVSDEGHEGDITRAIRKVHVHNPIPSKYGEWAPGERNKSITTDRILEDPIFRRSATSPLLQLADCASFALLKRETTPTALVKRYNIHKMFDAALLPVCFTKASRNDPLGIVRA